MVKTLLKTALVCVLILPCSVLMYRTGMLSISNALLLLAAALLVSCMVFFVATFCSFKYRKGSPDNAKHARLATYFCLIPIFALAGPIINGSKLPQIHNISTDTVDPPQFIKLVSLRAKSDNPLRYDSKLLANVQQHAYPKVKTLHSSSNLPEAFSKALETANAMQWQIIYKNQEQGIIEAVDTSFLWGFKDDIVIRLRNQDQQTVIDLRSVSRVGESDLGVNAKRIEKFITTFQALSGA